jgi:hypothetical protein
MAALGSQSIASSYEQLLHVDADGGGNGTTHVSVKDGDNGTTFGFTIATDALMMTGTNRLEFGDTGTYIHQSADGVLDLVSDTELELNATTIDMNGAVDMSSTLALAGDLNVDTDTLFVDVSADKVGINDASPAAALTIKGGTAGLSNDYFLIENAGDTNATVRIFEDNTSPTCGKIWLLSNNSTNVQLSGNDISYFNGGNVGIGDTNPSEAKLSIDNVQSGDVGIKINQTQSEASIELTGNGSIKFPGTQGASSDANSLDDYEEGTYTITASMSSGSITVNPSRNEAHYVKIGRKVFVSGEVHFSAVSSPSGTLSFNLPFTVGDFADLSERFIGSFAIQNCNFTDTVVMMHSRSFGGQTGFTIQQTTDNAAWSNLDASLITTSTEIQFSFSYSV